MGLVKNCLTPWYISARCINSAENNSTQPKVKLNLRILLTHLYTEFQFKMSICNGDNERKLKINGIFLSPRGITLPKINRPDPNSNSTCVFFNLVTHLYPEFRFKMSICNGDNERKLKINGIFLSPRGITLPITIRPDPNSNSACVFSWQTYVPNFIWKSPCMTNERKLNPEWRKGVPVTLYAPAILWRRHKKPLSCR